MDYMITFLEGVATFVSPCLLPMLPLYLAYFAADGAGAVQAGARDSAAFGRTLVNALGFVAGFTIVFVALGALAGSFGRLLQQHRQAVDIACGLIVILFGLHFAQVLRIPLLDRTLKPQARFVPSSFGSALLFGIVFGVGWTPCVGAFLGSALLLAATQESALHGMGLLVAYSLGLGLPFVISAVIVERAAQLANALKSRALTLNRVCGGLLVVIGILMATGTFNAWFALLV